MAKEIRPGLLGEEVEFEHHLRGRRALLLVRPGHLFELFELLCLGGSILGVGQVRT